VANGEIEIVRQARQQVEGSRHRPAFLPQNNFVGPGIGRVDASIIRNCRISTKMLQFRLEGFNVLNKPIWNDPNTTLSSPLYGTITSTRTPMRELQLGLKFVF